MSNLRKAAEMALDALENHSGNYKLSKAECVKYNAIEEALRQALAQPEYVTEVVAMHEDGTYTTKRTPIQKREWVGFTDEEKHELDDALNLQGRFPIIETIEARLKLKNS